VTAELGTTYIGGISTFDYDRMAWPIPVLGTSALPFTYVAAQDLESECFYWSILQIRMSCVKVPDGRRVRTHATPAESVLPTTCPPNTILLKYDSVQD
jgi:hypothetical protein